MYASTGMATDSARRSRANQWARMLAKPCRKLFQAKPMPELQMPDPPAMTRFPQEAEATAFKIVGYGD